MKSLILTITLLLLTKASVAAEGSCEWYNAPTRLTVEQCEQDIAEMHNEVGDEKWIGELLGRTGRKASQILEHHGYALNNEGDFDNGVGYVTIWTEDRTYETKITRVIYHHSHRNVGTVDQWDSGE